MNYLCDQLKSFLAGKTVCNCLVNETMFYNNRIAASDSVPRSDIKRIILSQLTRFLAERRSWWSISRSVPRVSGYLSSANPVLTSCHHSVLPGLRQHRRGSRDYSTRSASQFSMCVVLTACTLVSNTANPHLESAFIFPDFHSGYGTFTEQPGERHWVVLGACR